MRRTVMACQSAERPDGVVTPRSVRDLTKALAGASANGNPKGSMLQQGTIR